MKNTAHITKRFLAAFAVAVMIAGCRTSSCPLNGYRVGDSIDASGKEWEHPWKHADFLTRGIDITPGCDITLEAKDGRLVGTTVWCEYKTVAERDSRFKEVQDDLVEYYKDFLVERGAKESRVVIRGLKDTPLEDSSVLPGFHFTCRTPEFDKEICKWFGPKGY